MLQCIYTLRHQNFFFNNILTNIKIRKNSNKYKEHLSDNVVGNIVRQKNAILIDYLEIIW